MHRVAASHAQGCSLTHLARLSAGRQTPRHGHSETEPSALTLTLSTYAYPYPGQVREEVDAEEASRERSAKVRSQRGIRMACTSMEPCARARPHARV